MFRSAKNVFLSAAIVLTLVLLTGSVLSAEERGSAGSSSGSGNQSGSSFDEREGQKANTGNYRKGTAAKPASSTVIYDDKEKDGYTRDGQRTK